MERRADGAAGVLSEPLEGPAIELTAIVVAILVGVALATLDAALEAFGEVRLLDAEEGDGADARTAARLRREGRNVATRLMVGRVVALVVGVGLTVRFADARGPWVVTAVSLALVALLYASLSVGLGAVVRARAPRVALPLARWLRPLELLFIPLAAPIAAWGRFLDRRVPAIGDSPADDAVVREMEHMIEQREESGSLPEDFAELLLSVLEFKDTVAREVMVPRTQVVAIDIQTPIDEVLELIVREGHSRYPVYRERLDQVEGILYAKDLFRIFKDKERARAVSLARIIRRPTFFVPETHKIGKLLREMQLRRFHLAVVVDEFGGTSGVVTLEDILEEIVGEIQDEHDAEEQLIQEISTGRWWVDASVSIYDLGELLDAELEDDDKSYDSLGGMIVALAGRMPCEGDTVTAHGFEFIVREADERHVTRVEIRRLTPTPSPIPGEAEAAAE